MGALDYIVLQTLNPISLGSIYALVAIGLVVVFGILRLINFAHGDLMMVSCYVAFFLTAGGMPIFPSVVLAIIATVMVWANHKIIYMQ
mgnify:CR=1 FL=1